ncbi:MAG: hypothetical protein HY326_05275 [Chloroflexi bacterium]|nr:hypothetical protein [Chloroflexota bacterium]
MEYDYWAVVWRFLSPLFSAAIVGGAAGLATLMGIRRLWRDTRHRPRNLVAGFAAAGFIAAYLGALGLKPLGLLLCLILILLSLLGVITSWLDRRKS